MLKLTPQSALVGVLSGAASAVLAGSILTQSSLAIVLFFISPLPVMLAGLSFGATATLVGALACTVFVSFIVSTPAALIVGAISMLPSALAVFLIALARPAEEIGGESGHIVWFPLGDTVFFCALLIAAAFMAMGAYGGYDMAFATEFAATFEQQFKSVNPEFAPGADFAASLANFIFYAVPVIQPAMFTAVLTANLWFALQLVRKSGRLARPKDNWPLTLRMPKIALPAFALALASSFLSGPLGLIALTVCGVLGACFSFAGFAVLHERTIGKPWRTPVLFLAYFSAFFFLPVIAVFVFIGLFDTRRSAPVSKA
ncbi:MAG: DUF2232 domain-containing protein [Notoacmeibacter sp.]